MIEYFIKKALMSFFYNPNIIRFENNKEWIFLLQTIVKMLILFCENWADFASLSKNLLTHPQLYCWYQYVLIFVRKIINKNVLPIIEAST